MEKLTAIQEKLYEYIKSEIRSKGVAPTIREMCEYTELSSTSSIYHHLKTLERKGYIKRLKNKNRCISIQEDNFYGNSLSEYNKVPVIGEVSAGHPITAIENIEGYFPIPTEYLPNSTSFMLKIKGQSMVNAGIFNNDLVIVQQQPVAENGDIVIALIDDSVTCKRYFLEDDHIRLQPENDDYAPIYVKDLTILGKVIGLFRSCK